MRGPFQRFLIRWLVCSLGLWIAAGLLGSIEIDGSWGVIIVAGLILAIINTIIKPILVILSLPAILLTLGLFMLVINGLTVALTGYLYEPLNVGSFWAALFAGIIIGIVNYLVTIILEDKRS
ncbi:MAG: phage holin family protein [Candidatus Saccharimonadales bacterium]